MYIPFDTILPPHMKTVLSLTPENLNISVSLEYKNGPDEPSAAASLKMAEADEGMHCTLAL